MRTGLLLAENSEEAPKIAGCICTLGPKLETSVSEAMQTGDGLRGVLLDAAGVGLLESLGNLSFAHVRNEARKNNLFAGCRSGPGYNHVPMEAQIHLFSMVDSTGIGVSLMNSLVMIPAKSLSFFVVLHKKPHAETDAYKCRACDLTDCPYRIGNETKT
jgi:cobalamin-dependent methionine synthase I